jgi:hypothetical protein
MSLPGPRDFSVIREAPLYHSLSDGFSIAGFVFRAPYLRHQYRGAAHATRATFEWCGSWDSEYGYHLVRCTNCSTNSPPTMMAVRDRALRMIHTDVFPGGISGQPSGPPRGGNIPGYSPFTGRSGPHGDPRRGERTPESSRIARRYKPASSISKRRSTQMRQKYPKSDLFHRLSMPTADEIQRAMQGKAQHDQDSLSVPREDSFLGSLQRLADVEDD